MLNSVTTVIWNRGREK